MIPTLAPLAPIAEPRALPELAEPFLAWCGFVRRRSPATVRAYATDLADFLTFAAQVPVTHPQAVQPQHIEFYLSLLLERGRSAKTANRRLHALRSWFAWMERESLVTGNPASRCFLLPSEKRLPTYLSIPEQERVLTTLAARTDLLGRRDYALVATALLSGLRCRELAQLRLDHVDLEAKILRVVQGKGRKDRELPIVPSLARILRAYLTETRPALLGGGTRTSDYLFVKVGPWGTSQRVGAPMTTRGIWSCVRTALTPIVGRPVHPHVLRHSFATTLHARGGDLALIQSALGHANPRTTMIYTHMASERMRADLTRLLEPRQEIRERRAATTRAQKNRDEGD